MVVLTLFCLLSIAHLFTPRCLFRIKKSENVVCIKTWAMIKLTKKDTFDTQILMISTLKKFIFKTFIGKATKLKTFEYWQTHK